MKKIIHNVKREEHLLRIGKRTLIFFRYFVEDLSDSDNTKTTVLFPWHMHWPLIYTSQINADKKLSDLLGILTDAFCFV